MLCVNEYDGRTQEPYKPVQKALELQRCVLLLLVFCLLALKQHLFVLIFVTVYHYAFIENLLLRLILFTFRIKLRAPPLGQMNDFTLSPPPLSWQQFYVMPPSSFSVPPPDNYCTVPNMLFSHVMISSFRAKAHLVTDWCLYNETL